MSLPFDHSQPNHERVSVRLLPPLIVLVLAATAVPVELRPFDFATLSVHCSPRDVLENLLLYIPLGVVLAQRGFWRVLMVATLLSLFAESCQFFMMHRYPSPVDLACNAAGAMIGFLIGSRWRLDVQPIGPGKRTACTSSLATVAILGLVLASLRLDSRWGSKTMVANCRGPLCREASRRFGPSTRWMPESVTTHPATHWMEHMSAGWQSAWQSACSSFPPRLSLCLRISRGCCHS